MHAQRPLGMVLSGGLMLVVDMQKAAAAVPVRGPVMPVEVALGMLREGRATAGGSLTLLVALKGEACLV